MATMTVTLVQMDIQWLSPDANFRKIERLLQDAPASDLILLPETFATGFAVQEPEAEQHADTASAFLKRCAERWQAVVVGSVLVPKRGKKVNRLLWCEPNGRVQHYDKAHLFCLGKEGEYVLPGDSRKIFNLNGVRILPQVCYDLRFPVFQRNRDDYDVMINIANWPAARRNHWDTLLAARAIENQAYVLAVNRIGADGHNIMHNGGTQAYDFTGNLMAQVSDQREGACTVTLDTSERQHYLSKFPAHRDADPFTLG